MALLRRREAAPPDVAALVDADERIVSWAHTADGGAVVATSRGLWWPDTDGPRRIDWYLVDKAVWREGVLTVIEAEVVDDVLLVDRRPVRVSIAAPRDLPPTVRRRVEDSVVRTQVQPLPGGSARFVARKIPGVDGVRWFARLEEGTRDSDVVRSAVHTRIAQLRAAWQAEVHL